MTSWILTFVIVATVNGRAVERHHTELNMRGPEHCMSFLRDARRSIPRGARIVSPRCQEAWRT